MEFFFFPAVIPGPVLSFTFHVGGLNKLTVRSHLLPVYVKCSSLGRSAGIVTKL
jgi:hypothetical protein